MDLMNSGLINLMSTSMSGTWARQEAISENIANYETPGYKRKDVSFEDQLKRAVMNSFGESDLKSKLDSVKIVETEEADTVRMDGNGIDIEEESLEMVRAAYQFSYSQRILSDEFSRISTAINAGK